MATMGPVHLLQGLPPTGRTARSPFTWPVWARGVGELLGIDRHSQHRLASFFDIG